MIQKKTARKEEFQEGYPFQVWHSASTWDAGCGMVLHSHCATLKAAQKEVAMLREYKIQGERGLTRKNYYGRVTIRMNKKSN